MKFVISGVIQSFILIIRHGIALKPYTKLVISKNIKLMITILHKTYVDDGIKHLLYISISDALV